MKISFPRTKNITTVALYIFTNLLASGLVEDSWFSWLLLHLICFHNDMSCITGKLLYTLARMRMEKANPVSFFFYENSCDLTDPLKEAYILQTMF